jgi:hypothetical protein
VVESVYDLVYAYEKEEEEKRQDVPVAPAMICGVSDGDRRLSHAADTPSTTTALPRSALHYQLHLQCSMSLCESVWCSAVPPIYLLGPTQMYALPDGENQHHIA